MAQFIITNIPEPIDFEGNSEYLNRTLQNAKNLLMTRMGEVPYDRFRGFDPALYHLPIEKLRMALLPELDRVMLWEPDAEVVDAEATILPDGQVYIKVLLEIALTGGDE